jgi:hypothetical protein
MLSLSYPLIQCVYTTTYTNCGKRVLEPSGNVWKSPLKLWKSKRCGSDQASLQLSRFPG